MNEYCLGRDPAGRCDGGWQSPLSGGYLPEDWIPDPSVRLSLYIRLARLTEASEIDIFEEELLDRFCTLPEPAERLLAQARLRSSAKDAKIMRIDVGQAGVALTPHADNGADFSQAGLEAKNGRWLLQADADAQPPLERAIMVLDRVAG